VYLPLVENKNSKRHVLFMKATQKYNYFVNAQKMRLLSFSFLY